MIETTRHLAEGEECTLFYSHLKPTPCHCTHFLPPHPHNPAHIDLHPLTPLHTAPNPHHHGAHQPNDISRTVILDDDIEDDDIELFDCKAVLKSVSNKRTKYLLSSFPSLGRVFPTALIVFLAFASTILPHDTTTMMTNRSLHPAHRFHTPGCTSCDAGDGPPPSPTQSPLNPYAQAFRPRARPRPYTDHGTSTTTSTPRPPNTHTRHTPTHRPQQAPTRAPTHTPRIAPVTTAPASPPTPNISINSMWNNLSPTLQDSTFLQFSDTFNTHILTHTCPPDTPHDLCVAYLNIRTLTSDKHFFLSAFMFRYRIDVLFLTDTRISNAECSKHTLRSCLGTGYTILHTPPVTAH